MAKEGSIPFGMLSVSDGVADDILKEDLKHTASLLIDKARNTLDTTAAGKAADGRFGDAWAR